ncbi:MAG: hypothetical protein IPG74_00775 [Flavobacteriales bacterium]|nr:hypothetical protein [Flavobacteriales bacterium]MBK7553566.1 hypothetical protein [Flavobacteriales bacterium]MBK9195512.1 hypothetical protein [Flavobacteriales bacterium]MBP6575214.1 hypothetical protein [Flavobacteriales bacterium]
MKIDLLTYYKSVLDKISLVDRSIFRKELRKAFKNLVAEDREELKNWFRSSCVCKVNAAAETLVPQGILLQGEFAQSS